jgi:hypothetical protein
MDQADWLMRRLCFAICARSLGLGAAGSRRRSPPVVTLVLSVGYDAVHGRRHWRAAELKSAALSWAMSAKRAPTMAARTSARGRRHLLLSALLLCVACTCVLAACGRRRRRRLTNAMAARPTSRQHCFMRKISVVTKVRIFAP